MEEYGLIGKIFDRYGMQGLLVLAPLVMAGIYHKIRMAELKTTITEQKEEKADYKKVIVGNTEAITRMAGALENNTETIRDLRSYMERGK